MDKITLKQLALLAVEGKIETLRFASDGRTAVVKYYVGRSGSSNRILVEKRITPSTGEDGINRYDVEFLNLTNSC